jgi:hypothetical protein
MAGMSLTMRPKALPMVVPEAAEENNGEIGKWWRIHDVYLLIGNNPDNYDQGTGGKTPRPQTAPFI